MSALVTSLDSTVLALRLRELAGEERNVQVDFLLHLDEFDRRRAFVEAGHPSLWTYCLEVLHLREGAAGRRIQAMRVLRRFPRLEEALRDGRICLSTIALLGQVLTEENLDDLLGRAAYRTKADVDHLVASVQARTAPRAGVRKLPEREPGATSAPLPLARCGSSSGSRRCPAAQTPPEPAAIDRRPRRAERAPLARVRLREAEAAARDARRHGEPVVAPRHHRPRLQRGPRDAQVAPRAQDPGRRTRGGAPRGDPLRDREARQA